MKSIHSQADAMGWAIPFAAQHPPELPLRLSNLCLSAWTWPGPGRTARSSEALHVVSGLPMPPSLPSFLPCSRIIFRCCLPLPLPITEVSLTSCLLHFHHENMYCLSSAAEPKRTLRLHFSSCTIFPLFFFSQSFKVLRDAMLHGLRPLSSWLRPGFTWGQSSGAL